MDDHADPIERERKHARVVSWIVGGFVVVATVAATVMVRSGLRAEQRKVVQDARSTYQHRLSIERIHEWGQNRLASIRGKRRPTEPTDEDMKVYREAREAEEAFMDACKRCASAQECERDRLVIVAGQATGSYSPCD